MICISKHFGSRGGGTEILIMIGGQKCQFSAKSENWTNVYVCCSCKLITNDEYLVCLHSFDFTQNTHIKKKCTIPYFINLISNKANYAVRGPTSL